MKVLSMVFVKWCQGFLGYTIVKCVKFIPFKSHYLEYQLNVFSSGLIQDCAHSNRLKSGSNRPSEVESGSQRQGRHVRGRKPAIIKAETTHHKKTNQLKIVYSR
jgi:hypothetical protein